MVCLMAHLDTTTLYKWSDNAKYTSFQNYNAILHSIFRIKAHMEGVVQKENMVIKLTTTTSHAGI